MKMISNPFGEVDQLIKASQDVYIHIGYEMYAHPVQMADFLM